MREIKFRVWGLEENKWVNLDGIPEKDYTYQFVGKGKKFPYKQIFGLENFAKYQKGWHWMQYTGLKDKNGKEIYEGDIIIGLFAEVFGSEDIPCLIEPIGTEEVSEGYLSICASPRGKDGCYALQLGEENIEIIGNIYENPELLNENI